MFDFYYNYIKEKFGEKAKLLFTDTDSLMYEIETEDFYKDITGDLNDLFDTSNYSPDHPSKISSGLNKKVIGKFKDEAGGKQIVEFVGLRSKLYSYKMDEKVENKGKGVKKQVIKNKITFDDYKNCLFVFQKKKKMRQMNIIKSNRHNIYSVACYKVALSCND